MKTLLALAAAATLAAPALAQPRSGSWQVGNDSFHIYYEDLDMHTAAGRAALLTRVETAAHHLCLAQSRLAEDECVQDTVAQIALPAVKQALLERQKTIIATR